MQVNIRAMYKMLYDKVDAQTNDLMYYIGFIGMIALNGVGIFDEHNYGHIHLIVSITFFACIGIYAIMLGNQL